VLFEVAVQSSQLFIPLVFPDFGDVNFSAIAQDFFTRVIHAAQRDVSVDQDCECLPQPNARLSNIHFTEEPSFPSPILQVSKDDPIHSALDHMSAFLFVGSQCAGCHDSWVPSAPKIPHSLEVSGII